MIFESVIWANDASDDLRIVTTFNEVSNRKNFFLERKGYGKRVFLFGFPEHPDVRMRVSPEILLDKAEELLEPDEKVFIGADRKFHIAKKEAV